MYEPHQENYDVIVVGSGMGGLSAGSITGQSWQTGTGDRTP